LRTEASRFLGKELAKEAKAATLDILDIGTGEESLEPEGGDGSSEANEGISDQDNQSLN